MLLSSSLRGFVVTMLMVLVGVVSVVVEDTLRMNNEMHDAELLVVKWHSEVEHTLENLVTLGRNLKHVTEVLLREDNLTRSSSWKYAAHDTMWESMLPQDARTLWAQLEPNFIPTVVVPSSAQQRLEDHGGPLLSSFVGTDAEHVFARFIVNVSDAPFASRSDNAVAAVGSVVIAFNITDISAEAMCNEKVFGAWHWALANSTGGLLATSVGYSTGNEPHEAEAQVTTLRGTQRFNVIKLQVYPLGGWRSYRTETIAAIVLAAILLGIIVAGLFYCKYSLDADVLEHDLLPTPILAPMALILVDLQQRTSHWRQHPIETAETMESLREIVQAICDGSDNALMVTSNVGTQVLIAAQSCQDALNCAILIDQIVAEKSWPPEIRARVGLPIRMLLHYSAQVSVMYDGVRQGYEYAGPGVADIHTLANEVRFAPEERIVLTAVCRQNLKGTTTTKFIAEVRQIHSGGVSLFRVEEVAVPGQDAVGSRLDIIPDDEFDAFSSREDLPKVASRKKGMADSGSVKLQPHIGAVKASYFTLRTPEDTLLTPAQLDRAVGFTFHVLMRLFSPLSMTERARVLRFFANVFGVPKWDIVYGLATHIVLVGADVFQKL